MLPSSSQLIKLNTTECLALGPFQTTSDSNQTTAKRWELCKCVTRAFGRMKRTRTVRNVVTKKVQKLVIIVWSARAEDRAVELCIQRRRRTRLRKNKSTVHFLDHPYFQKKCDFCLYSSKMVKEYSHKHKRLQTNDFNPKAKERKSCSLFCPYLKEKMKANKKV